MNCFSGFFTGKDFESALIQAKAMDKRLDENGDRVLNLGRLSASNQEYSLAEKCFQYVVEKGEKIRIIFLQELKC